MCFQADPIQSKLPLQEVHQEDHLLIPFSLPIDHQVLPGTAPQEHHPVDHLGDPREDSLEDHLEDLAMGPWEEVITIYHLLDHPLDHLPDHLADPSEDHRDHPL